MGDEDKFGWAYNKAEAFQNSEPDNLYNAALDLIYDTIEWRDQNPRPPVEVKPHPAPDEYWYPNDAVMKMVAEARVTPIADPRVAELVQSLRNQRVRGYPTAAEWNEIEYQILKLERGT